MSVFCHTIHHFSFCVLDNQCRLADFQFAGFDFVVALEIDLVVSLPLFEPHERCGLILYFELVPGVIMQWFLLVQL